MPPRNKRSGGRAQYKLPPKGQRKIQGDDEDDEEGHDVLDKVPETGTFHGGIFHQGCNAVVAQLTK